MKTKRHTLIVHSAGAARWHKQTAARAATALPMAMNPAATCVTAQTFTDLHSLTAGNVEFQSKRTITNDDGAFPRAGLILSGSTAGFSRVGQVWLDGGGNE
jgi:hypothetical protein